MISFLSRSDLTPLAPVGYPPIKLIKIVAAVLPGKLKRNLVVRLRNFPIRADKPDSTINADKNINGNNDGINISDENRSP